MRTGDTPAGGARAAGQAPADGARHHAREPHADACRAPTGASASRTSPRRRRRVARAAVDASAACRPSWRWRGCAALRPALRVWGLSATLANLDEALACLVGAGAARARAHRQGPRRQGDRHRQPARRRRSSAFRGPATSASSSCREVDPRDRAARNRRSSSPTCARQTEIWYQAILEARPDWAGTHRAASRLARARRARLGRGRRCATAGCAPSSARRASTSASTSRRSTRCCRSAARRASRACCSAPAAAATGPARSRASRSCRRRRWSWSRRPPRARPRPRARSSRARRSRRRWTCWSSISSPARSAAASCRTSCCAEMRGTHAYAALTDAQWQWALDFVVHGGASLNAYPEYRRVVIGDDGVARVPDARDRAPAPASASARSSPRRASPCSSATATALGHVEESSSRGSRPATASCSPAACSNSSASREMTAWVKPAAATKPRIVPRWTGGKMALSTLLADAHARRSSPRRSAASTPRPNCSSCGRCSNCSARWSALPGEREWLIERIATRDGHYLFFYPFEGRLAHLGLATLFSYRLSRDVPRTFSLTVNDYGFGLLSPTPVDAVAGRPRAACSPHRTSRPTSSRGSTPRNSGAASSAKSRASPASSSRAIPGEPQSGAATAGVERPALRRVRRVRSGQPAAGAGGARSAGAAPRSAAPRRRARAAARQPRAADAVRRGRRRSRFR